MLHQIPFDSKSETRLFVIFSLRAIATTTIGMLLGIFIGSFFYILGLTKLFILSIILCGLAGFIIGTFKTPNIKSMPVTEELTDMYPYEVALKKWKFNQRKKIYVIYKGE